MQVDLYNGHKIGFLAYWIVGWVNGLDICKKHICLVQNKKSSDVLLTCRKKYALNVAADIDVIQLAAGTELQLQMMQTVNSSTVHIL